MTNDPPANLLVKILSQPRTCHCQAPAGIRAARTLPRPSDSDWPGANYASGPYLTSPGGLDQPGQYAIPRENGIRLNPPPEILSRPPACHYQARRGTRCTDSESPAGRRPGLDRAPVTLHRSCTPRARRELRRCRPLEHRHSESGCTGATAASGDSDMPPWGRTHGIRQPGWPANTGPQTRRTGHGPRNKRPQPTQQEPPPGGTTTRNQHLEAAHHHYRTRARHQATQTKPMEQS
jgi:hypothetical protein